MRRATKCTEYRESRGLVQRGGRRSTGTGGRPPSGPRLGTPRGFPRGIARPGLVAPVLWGLLLIAPARGADPPPSRAEVLHFDPARQEWVLETPPVPGTAEGDLRLARTAHAAGDNAQAQKAVVQWIKTYGELDERYPEAVLLRCRIMIARKDYYAAHKALQSFLNEFGGTTYVDEALTMEFVVADVFLGGARRKFLGMPILKADDVGIAILDDIANNHPDTSLAELAVMAKANYYYFKSNDYPFAEQEYGGLLEAFPRSRYVRRAMLQSARAALASFPGVEFDDAPLVEAEERFRQYLVQYPGTAEQEGIGLALTQIAEQRAEKEYTIGRYYERTGHARAAAFYYRSTLDNWPEAIAAVRATERLQGLGLEPPQEGN